jgi:hypothetical protein
LIVEYLLRFIIGGLAVSAFAALGDVLRPKSFAGLFGAAPSIAIATLGIAVWKDGSGYAATEARSMILGAVALCVYCVIVCQALKRYRLHALLSTIVALPAWLACALGLTWLFLGQP